MTLANNYVPISQAADGTTVAFSGAFQMIEAAFALVYLENTTTGAQTLITQGSGASQYQISLSSSGFVVTFNTAPTIGNNILIGRATTPDQTNPYSTSRGFQGAVEEDSFDKLTAIAQENVSTVNRNISVPLGDTATNLQVPIAALRAGQFLAFDGSGNVIVANGSSAGTAISAAMVPVVQAVSTAAASALLLSANSSIWSTGDAKLTLKTVADAGWVLANDGTIGSAASGATTRANADTQALYTLIYNNVSNTYAPVTGGRGVSAAADFAANKAIALTKQLGRALGIAGTGSGLTARTLGQTVGEETHLLTTPEIPAHLHQSWAQLTAATGNLQCAQNTLANTGQTAATSSDATFATANTGGGGAHNNMQPTSFWNIMIKL